MEFIAGFMQSQNTEIVALPTGGLWDEDTKFIDVALKELLSGEVAHTDDMKKLSLGK